MSGDIFGCDNWGRGTTSILWIEARDLKDAQGWPPRAKNYLAPNVNTDEVEKPCCIPILANTSMHAHTNTCTHTPFLYTSGRYTTHFNFIFSFSLNHGDCSVSAQIDPFKLQNILLYKWSFIYSVSYWETFRLFPASTNNIAMILVHKCPDASISVL